MFGILGWILGGIVGLLIFEPFQRSIKHTQNYLYPNVLLPPSEAVELRRRGKLSVEEYLKELRLQGYNTRRAELLYSLSERLLEISELIKLRYRGEITPVDYHIRAAELGFSAKDAERLFKAAEQRLPPEAVIRAMWREIKFGKGIESYREELKQQGWTDERIDVLEKVARFYPSPDDFIRFMVRDTFNEEVVRKYGYDEAYPKEIEKFVKKAGVDPEWMKHYWRAHWQLPSPTMGYTMLHRGVIDMDDLRTLLKIADYPPYWIDKLIQISYHPFTRVDIRRMHKLGVLSDEDLVKAYMEIGYDEEKAKKLAEFTIKYNQDVPDVEKTEEDKRREELRGLTKSVIIKQFKENLLTEEEAKQYLKDLGFSDEVIELYIAMAKYEVEEERVNKYLHAYRRMFINGVIDYNKASDLLDELNIPARQKEFLLDLWELEKINKPAQPSKTELAQFLSLGIIDEETYKEKMRDLGYSDQYIDWYLKYIHAKRKGAKK